MAPRAGPSTRRSRRVRRSGAARAGSVFSSDSDASLSLPDEPDDSDVTDPFWARPALRSASGSGSPSPPPRDAFHASVPYDEARTRTPPREPGAPTRPPLSAEEQAELADLDPEEIAVFLRAKQERQRQERIAGVERIEREQAEAQRAERERRAQEERDRWKLTAAQLALMERTAAAVRASSTPDVLQMRILAGHGADARFSFLRRGREQHWGAEWERLLRGERVTLAEEKKGLLVGYDSDSEESEGCASGPGEEVSAATEQVAAPEEQAAPTAAPAPSPTLPPDSGSKRPLSPDADALAAAKAARLQRAREWASKRRQELAGEAATQSAPVPQDESDV